VLGISIDEIRRTSTMNIQDKDSDVDKSFNVIEGTAYALQKLDAPTSAKAISILAKRYNIKVDIEFYWLNEEKAAFPNEYGKIINN
jgi:hypothetical protein